MKRNYKRIRTKFEPETRFKVRPEPAAPFRAVQETELEKLKTQLLEERLAQDLESELNSYLRRAANEAASLAWVTGYPLLLFPGLFEEKAWTASIQLARQDRVRQRSLELLPI
jgi:hypothetical protein